MRFQAVPIEEAEGHILGHNVADSDGRRILRKGKALTSDDIEVLKSLGRHSVYAALIAPGDVDENTAARRIAQKAAGRGIHLSKASTGRVNLLAAFQGVFRVDLSGLMAVNSFSGVTLATLEQNVAVPSGTMVGTLKIIPYALPASIVEEVVNEGSEKAVLSVEPAKLKRAGLILSGSPAVRERVVPSFQAPLAQRLEKLEASFERVDYVSLEDEAGEQELAEVIQEYVAAGIEIIILAGETAIMDRYDITPRAVERAGGEVISFGAPVDPGNLLMLAYLDDVPILGAPGCARSPKKNVIDMILPRLIVGDRLTREDIIRLAHGGLLEDVPERPLPRSQLR